MIHPGKIKKAPPSEVARWVSAAWAKISPELVQKSFRKCCLSNALDGSQDYELWHDEEQSSGSDTSDNESDDNDIDSEEEE